MKNPLVCLIVGALCTVAVAETPAQLAEAHFRRGVAAEQAGDPATARKSYEEALRVNPRHANARFRIGELKKTAPAIAARGREARIGAVVVPLIQLEEASLQESIEALGMMIEKESGGEVAPNFVIQDPQGRLSAAKITLNLKGVPTKGVLDYILTQAGAKVRYDEHAVVITPR
jgi:tetratricopeptide (TPR) repeat protein